MFTWTKMIQVNMSIQKILTWFGPFGKKFHSRRGSWFMPIIIPNAVHVHTHSDPFVLLGVKLSPLRMSTTSVWHVYVFAAAGRSSASKKQGRREARLVHIKKKTKNYMNRQVTTGRVVERMNEDLKAFVYNAGGRTASSRKMRQPWASKKTYSDQTLVCARHDRIIYFSVQVNWFRICACQHS